jgi:hypothetical protein
MQAVHAVSLDVMREAARAPDAGNEDRALGRELFVAAESLDAAQDGVVPASGTPPRGRALVILETVIILVDVDDALIA